MLLSAGVAGERIAAVFNFSDEEQELAPDLDGAGVIKKIFDSAGSEDGAEQVYDRKKNRVPAAPVQRRVLQHFRRESMKFL